MVLLLILREHTFVMEYAKTNANHKVSAYVGITGSSSISPSLNSIKMQINKNYSITEKLREDWEKNGSLVSHDMPYVIREEYLLQLSTAALRDKL